MPINNSLINVRTLQQKFSMPTLMANLTYASLANKKFKNYKNIECNRGDTVEVRLPTLFNVRDSLTFDPKNSGSFSERIAYLKVDTPKGINYAMTDTELATYPLEQLADEFSDDAMTTLAGNIDSYIASKAVTAGYRWIGNHQAANNSFSTFQDLRKAATLFRNFGGNEQALFVLPDTASTLIANSGFQEFTPSRNDSLVDSWELGMVNGIANAKFYQSQLNPVHTSGTASSKDNITITNVTTGTHTVNKLDFSSSTISLSGLEPGNTIVTDDVGDIVGNDPIKYLRQQDKSLTDINPQFRVITGGTADQSGNLDIIVEPALIFDATKENTERNLSRAIVTATDKVRIVPSHKTGVAFFGDALLMANPKLPNKANFPSAVEQDKSGISLRTYHGGILGEEVDQMVHDTLIGVTGARDYFARLIFPLSSGDLSI